MSWGSWLFISCWREEKLNLSKVWFGSMSQSCGMKDALCFHQTLTAMLRSYERTWWNLWKEFASKETCCYIFFSGYLKSLEINDCFNLSPGYSYKVIKIFLLWLWFQVTGYMNNYAGQILVLHNPEPISDLYDFPIPVKFDQHSGLYNTLLFPDFQTDFT